MSILLEGDRRKVQEALAAMTNPVRLVFFTQTFGCETCAPTRQILDALVELGDKITLEEHNFILEAERVAASGVDKVPAIIIAGEGRSVRYYGAPAGYEFMSLVDAIVLVSTGDSRLSDDSKALLAAVQAPLHIQVFVTPT